MKNKIVNNQRLMTFANNSDIASEQPSGGHLANVKFSEKYIKGKKLLSVGSWTGLFEGLIQNLPSELTAVDIEERALQVLKKRIPEAKIQKAFSHKLPFKNSSFDVVTFWAVIEHIPEGYELASIQEIRRVIKKGGIFFLSTMNKSFFSDLLDPAYWLVGHRHYKEENLVSMLTDAGFKVEKVKKHGGFIVAFDTILYYILKHIFHADRPNIGLYHRKVAADYEADGFYEVAIRAKAL